MKKKSQLSKAIFILLVIIIIAARYAPNPNGKYIHNHPHTQPSTPSIETRPVTDAEMEEILNHLNRDIPSKSTSKSNSSSNDLDNYNNMIDKINADSEARFNEFKQSTTDAFNSHDEIKIELGNYEKSYKINVVDTYYRNDKQ